MSSNVSSRTNRCGWDIPDREGQETDEGCASFPWLASLRYCNRLSVGLKGLGQGQTTEPFLQGTFTYWLHVQKVERTPGRSLFDVQRQLADEIHQRRNNEEWDRYVRSLFEKGIYDELEDMADRLLEIALQRYAG